MKSLDRMYYPLPEAAEKIGFNIQDLLHLGATGRLEICAFIPKIEKLVFDVEVRENGEFVYEQIKKNGEIWDRYYLIENITLIDDSNKQIMFDCQADTLSGFFALYSQDIVRFEFNRKDDFEIGPTKIFTPTSSGYDFGFFGVQGIKISRDNLVVMAAEVNDFDLSMTARRPGDDRGDSKEIIPNKNKQAKLIKSLLHILYGKKDADSPRGLLEPGGELLSDLDKLGIRPPVSGKSLKAWLDDVDLEYMEISGKGRDISEN